MAQEKEETKPTIKPKTKEEIARDKRVRRNCCCCGGFLLLLLIIGIVITVSLFGAFKNIPIIPSKIAPTVSTTTPTKTTANYPAPTACSQVNTPAAAGIGISPSDPGFKQDSSTIYYSVYGYNYTQLGDQVRQCGPKVGSESFGGITNYNISWKADWDYSSSSCGLKNTTVGIKVDVYLPKWKKTDGSISLSDWEHYVSVLTDHENQHKAMDLAAGQSLYNQLVSLPAAATCDEENVQASDIYNKVMSDIAAQNKQFDIDTNHGANQM